MGRCKQKQRGLRGLLCRWPSITEWEVHITAQAPPVSGMTYTVSSGTLNPSIPYHSSSGMAVCHGGYSVTVLFIKDKDSLLRAFGIRVDPTLLAVNQLLI